MLTGIREAVRALHLLRNDSQEAAAEAANMVSAEAHKPRKGVRAAKAKSPLGLHHGQLRRPCKTVFQLAVAGKVFAAMNISDPERTAALQAGLACTRPLCVSKLLLCLALNIQVGCHD